MSPQPGFPIYKNGRLLKHLFGNPKNIKFLQDFLESLNGLEKGSLKGIKIIESEVLDDNAKTNSPKFRVVAELPDGSITCLII